MSRNENENVEFLKLPDSNTVDMIYYVHGGKKYTDEEYLNLVTETKDRNIPNICCKMLTNKETGLTTYYILCNNMNQMFDPKNKDFRYKKRSNWKFRRVNRSTFDTYVKFLQQNYKSLLTQAERGL